MASNMSNTSMIVRLSFLDGLRGIAAFAVVFWHWQHFFFNGTVLGPLRTDAQPFYQAFAFFYREGWRAVPLFFALSGVIFFWLAEEKLASKKLSLTAFAVDRFSRIYPLYIITFVAVFIVQWFIRGETGSYFVYAFYDTYHAVLNILLMSAWGLEEGWSFNAPVWSISVEILLYITFAVGCMLGKARYIYFVGLLILGHLLPASAYKVASGLTQFYLAGLLFAVFREGKRQFGDRVIAPFVFVVLVCWSVLIFVPEARKFLLDTMAFPLGIIALTALNMRYQRRIRLFEWLGDVSYSVYLWHFPLQCVFVLTAFHIGYDRTVFYSPTVMLAFFGVASAISILSFSYIELPAKQILRSLLKGGPSTLAQAKPVNPNG
ncbi:acyltransferase [Agrobacterium leguminum]|uniref:Acyltransferase n=2 Tax=Agrobacterium leguminum TaxID=2792015 RepID=A0A9X3QWK4_9HYPH|nr:acyltransferase [Agrobacterium leguminum]